jgi:hypothetical protein
VTSVGYFLINWFLVLLCSQPSFIIPVTFLQYYLVTYSMEQSTSWEANWFADSQEIPRVLWNPNVHYRTDKRPPPVPILSQPNPVHTPTTHFPKIRLNIILPSTPGSPQCSCNISDTKQLITIVTHYERYQSVLCTDCFERGTWSVTLREAYKLKAIDNRVLGEIFGPKRAEVIADWRKLPSEEFCTTHQILFGWSIKKNEMGGTCGMCGVEEMCV